MIEPVLIHIPAGNYILGVPEPPDDVLHLWSGPRAVAMQGFQIAKCSVTIAEFMCFLQDTELEIPQHFAYLTKQQSNLPAGGLSWFDAEAYVQWLKAKTGKPYRLPTSDEWETAARGGLSGRKFPWGDEHPLQRSDFHHSSSGHAQPVRSYAPNGYHLYDMAGSIWNWCADLWIDCVPSQPPVNSPANQDPRLNRVLRGGSFMTRTSGYLMCACIHEDPPDLRDPCLGMRVACDCS